MSTPVYFVYLRGSRGPTPQKWYGDQVTGNGTFQHGEVGDPNSALLFFKELDKTERRLSLRQLEQRYPFKKNGEA